MPHRVYRTKYAKQDCDDLLARYPNHQNRFIDAYTKAKDWIARNGTRGSGGPKAVAAPVSASGIGHVQFTEYWTIDWPPIRMHYYAAYPNGPGGVGVFLVFGVDEIPPHLATHPNHPGSATP